MEYDGIFGAVWPESTTQFGTMNPNDWGCAVSPQVSARWNAALIDDDAGGLRDANG